MHLFKVNKRMSCDCKLTKTYKFNRKKCTFFRKSVILQKNCKFYRKNANKNVK